MKKFIIILHIIFWLIGIVSAEAETYINDPNITVIMNMTDKGSGMGEMRFSLDNVVWTDVELYSTRKELTLNGEDGEHCVWAMFSDQAGNWTEPLMACAILDTTVPGGDIEIQGIEIIIKFVPVKEGDHD